VQKQVTRLFSLSCNSNQQVTGLFFLPCNSNQLRAPVCNFTNPARNTCIRVLVVADTVTIQVNADISAQRIHVCASVMRKGFRIAIEKCAVIGLGFI
jgi:hypothetical protein